MISSQPSSGKKAKGKWWKGFGEMVNLSLQTGFPRGAAVPVYLQPESLWANYLTLWSLSPYLLNEDSKQWSHSIGRLWRLSAIWMWMCLANCKAPLKYQVFFIILGGGELKSEYVAWREKENWESIPSGKFLSVPSRTTHKPPGI